jgi:hypothetical protein
MKILSISSCLSTKTKHSANSKKHKEASRIINNPTVSKEEKKRDIYLINKNNRCVWKGTEIKKLKRTSHELLVKLSSNRIEMSFSIFSVGSVA